MTKVHIGLLSNSFEWNIRSLAKYHKINYIGNSGNNVAKFIYYQILTKTLILKLKWNEIINATVPILLIFC